MTLNTIHLFMARVSFQWNNKNYQNIYQFLKTVSLCSFGSVGVLFLFSDQTGSTCEFAVSPKTSN